MHETQELYCLLPYLPNFLFLHTQILRAHRCLQAGNAEVCKPQPLSALQRGQRHLKRPTVLPETGKESFGVCKEAIPHSS